MGSSLGVGVLLLLIVGFAAAELLIPEKVKEGFEALVPVLAPNATYFAKFIPRRGDVDEDYDPRYFHGFVDVQRLGVENDFCRLVSPKNEDPTQTFFACALAGTENLSSTSFKSPTVSEGFRLSRDDYMRDINDDGRADYCRILKGRTGAYEAICNKATDFGFDSRETVDTDTPEDIQMLLRFYNGCVFWFRFVDDMKDYVENVRLFKVGEMKIQEFPPNPIPARALHFNGIDQYIRLGDNADLELGHKVPVRSLRAMMMWVYFDEFTNNARILDFGDGAGKFNIVLGIIGRGDATIEDSATIRSSLICGEDSTVPSAPSGAQPVKEMTPQKLMETTSANVDEFTCPGFEIFPRKLPASRVQPRQSSSGDRNKATLLYEIWDSQQRMMRLRVPSAITKKKWTHIVITATSMDSFRPDIAIYINGKQVFLEPSGFLPQSSTLTNNYIGRSNWSNDTSQYENKDELFKGKMFDLRGYKVNLPQKVVEESYEWGRKKLGLV
jgi:hypothetical protein